MRITVQVLLMISRSLEMNMRRRHFYCNLVRLGVIGVVVHSTACLAAKTKQDELPGQPRSSVAATPRPAANTQPAPLTREAASAQLQAQFQALDTNKDGYLSQA